MVNESTEIPQEPINLSKEETRQKFCQEMADAKKNNDWLKVWELTNQVLDNLQTSKIDTLTGIKIIRTEPELQKAA